MPLSDPPDTASPRTPPDADDMAIRRLIRRDRQLRKEQGLGPPGTSTQAEAAEALCDALCLQDLSTYEPADNGKRFLKVANLAGALSDVILSPDGTVQWDYHPFAGTAAGPGTTAAIILAILNPDHAPAGPLPAADNGATLAGLLGSAAAAHGIRAADITPSDITAESPARPHRGWVFAADNGAIWWTCPLAGLPPGKHGLDPDQIAATIARALTISGAARTTPPGHLTDPNPAAHPRNPDRTAQHPAPGAPLAVPHP